MAKIYAKRCCTWRVSERLLHLLNAKVLAEQMDLGFEHRLQQLYRCLENAETSMGYFAQEMGLKVRELYAALEEREWPTSSITLHRLGGMEERGSEEKAT